MIFIRTFLSRFTLPTGLALSLVSLGLPSPALADVELPFGSLSACPFVHDDAYDLAPLLETLKSQLSAELDNRNNCRQAIQAIVANLAPLQDFYKSIAPDTRQRIAKSIYANALVALSERKLMLEAGGDSSSYEYQMIAGQISAITSSDLANEIDLESVREINNQNTEAYYRSQIAVYVTNVLNAYNSTLRSNPRCIGALGGWGTALSAVTGGFSIATGLGSNPSAQVIGAAVGAATQLVTLLQDSKVRTAYNDLVRIKNYKTLACTYYSIKKASCEYQRAFRISQEVSKLRQFLRNRFESNQTGEYERFFVNRGRIKVFGDIFSMIAQMGSPLTLDQTLLNSYLAAKAVDFKNLGDPPLDTASDERIKAWLIRARAFGVSFPEINFQNGGVTIEIPEQLATAKADIQVKKATITSAETIIRENLSFLDLRRRLSSEFPNVRENINELKNYLTAMKDSALVVDTDKGTIDATIRLIDKLRAFLDVAISNAGVPNAAYEDEVVSAGGEIFEELAKGSVAQLTKQSVLALGGKGIDRLGWAFGVIRNAYLNRDLELGLPPGERFAEYQRSRDALADVIGNYQAFSGTGTTFRNEEFAKVVSSFESGFRKEMLQSLQLALGNEAGIPELKGNTAAHLCAMYYPSLETMSRQNLFGENRPARVLAQCKERFKSLPTNRLVADADFPIEYSDSCTYFTYSRELEIQNLLALLIKP